MADQSNECAEERRRILRACAEGRLLVNDSGRYVIDGEKKRPDRKVREKLMYHDPPFINWPAWTMRHCTLTTDGRGELRDLEALLR